jgi:hypothetical protein
MTEEDYIAAEPRYNARDLGDLLPLLREAGLQVDLHGEVPLPGAAQHDHPFGEAPDAGAGLSDDEWDALVERNSVLSEGAFVAILHGLDADTLYAGLPTEVAEWFRRGRPAGGEKRGVPVRPEVDLGGVVITASARCPRCQHETDPGECHMCGFEEAP